MTENGTEPSRTTLKLPPLSGETLTPESLAKLNSGGDQGVSGDSVSGGGGGGGGQGMILQRVDFLRR